MSQEFGGNFECARTQIEYWKRIKDIEIASNGV